MALFFNLLFYIDIKIMKNEKYNILERTKIQKSLSEKMDKYCLKHGWSRSQLLREALIHFLEYEESLVQQELKNLQTEMSEVKDYLRILVDLHKN